MTTKTAITAQAILAGSDRLHRMQDDVKRILDILKGVIKTELLDGAPPRATFIELPEHKEKVHCLLELDGSMWWLCFCLAYGDVFRRVTLRHGVGEVSPRLLTIIHSHLDEMVKLVLDAYPGTRDTLGFLASQTLTPEERVVE